MLGNGCLLYALADCPLDLTRNERQEDVPEGLAIKEIQKDVLGGLARKEKARRTFSFF